MRNVDVTQEFWETIPGKSIRKTSKWRIDATPEMADTELQILQHLQT